MPNGETAEGTMAYFIPDVEGGGLRIEEVQVNGVPGVIVASTSPTRQLLAALVFNAGQADMAAAAFSLMASSLRAMRPDSSSIDDKETPNAH